MHIFLGRAAKVARFLFDRTGATSIEYALIASLIAVSVVAGATAIGIELSAMLGQLPDQWPDF